MLQSALVLAVLGLTPVPRHSDSARTLSADELQLYTLTIRDVLLTLDHSQGGAGPIGVASHLTRRLE